MRFNLRKSYAVETDLVARYHYGSYCVLFSLFDKHTIRCHDKEFWQK